MDCSWGDLIQGNTVDAGEPFSASAMIVVVLFLID